MKIGRSLCVYHNKTALKGSFKYHLQAIVLQKPSIPPKFQPNHLGSHCKRQKQVLMDSSLAKEVVHIGKLQIFFRNKKIICQRIREKCRDCLKEVSGARMCCPALLIFARSLLESVEV